MKSSGWKSALIGSAMAFGSQVALAGKPLPCPTNSPLVDISTLIQGDTKQRVESRLRALDVEKHHQVVVVTVDNLEEYGYTSIEEMANAFGTNCKVGYRGEDTGTVVLYTKIPSRYRIENAGTERYITDAQSKEILTHSKSDGVCIKEDVSCRLDDITLGLDQIIRREFSDTQSVQNLKVATQEFDEKKAAKENAELLNNLGIGAIIITVLGSGIIGGNALIARNRRKALKKQIFELNVRLKAEMTKYPEWFLIGHVRETDETMDLLNQYSDEQLDDIAKGGKQGVTFSRYISLVEDSCQTMSIEFQKIIERVETRRSEVFEQITEVGKLQKSLQGAGFVFGSLNIPSTLEGGNPDETLSLLERASQDMTEGKAKLSAIPPFYNSIAGLDERIQGEFTTKKAKLATTTQEYESIYGTAKLVDLGTIENQVGKIAKEFQRKYQGKDIMELRTISRQAESLFVPITMAIDTMVRSIRWYNEIPSQVDARQKKLQEITVRSEYRENAQKYIQKTGERKFYGYDMGAKLNMLHELLTFIKDSYTQKKNLETIDKKLSEFDTEKSKIVEFMGLGAALTGIIAAEIAAAKRAEEQRIEEQRRREEAEARRRRQQEEDEERRQRDSSRSSSNDDDGWRGGGGGGFGGGGASSD